MRNIVKLNFLMLALLTGGGLLLQFAGLDTTGSVSDGIVARQACETLMEKAASVRLVITAYAVILLLIHFACIYHKAIGSCPMILEKLFLSEKFNITLEFLVAVFNAVLSAAVILAFYALEFIFDCALLDSHPG